MVNEISAAEFDVMLADLDCRVMERGESAEAAAEAVTGGNRELDALLVSAYRGGVGAIAAAGSYSDEMIATAERCGTCGDWCYAHPHASNPLAYCGDCGAVTCSEHRDETSAQRCPSCAARFTGDRER